LDQLACIGVDYDADSDFDVDSDSLGVIPYDFDVIQSDCTNHVAGSTYAFDCYVEVQAVEPISPSPPAPDIQPSSPVQEGPLAAVVFNILHRFGNRSILGQGQKIIAFGLG